MAEPTSRCLGYQQTICDELSEVPCGLNTTSAAFIGKATGEYGGNSSHRGGAGQQRVDDAKSVQIPVFSLPLHHFYHSASPITYHQQIGFDSKRDARIAPVQRLWAYRHHPASKQRRNSMCAESPTLITASAHRSYPYVPDTLCYEQWINLLDNAPDVTQLSASE